MDTYKISAHLKCDFHFNNNVVFKGLLYNLTTAYQLLLFMGIPQMDLICNCAGHQLDEPMGFFGDLRQQSIIFYFDYCQIFNIRRTKSQNFNASCHVLQLPLFIILKPCVKSRKKM